MWVRHGRRKLSRSAASPSVNQQPSASTNLVPSAKMANSAASCSQVIPGAASGSKMPSFIPLMYILEKRRIFARSAALSLISSLDLGTRNVLGTSSTFSS